MLLPVATTDPSPDGFTWTLEGELVYPAWTCAGDPDTCGCGRAFAGLDSHKATTRAVIRDVPMDFTELRTAIVKSLARGGWVHLSGELTEEDADLVAEVAVEMIEIGETFGEGAALMRHLNDIFLAS